MRKKPKLYSVKSNLNEEMAVISYKGGRKLAFEVIKALKFAEENDNIDDVIKEISGHAISPDTYRVIQIEPDEDIENMASVFYLNGILLNEKVNLNLEAIFNGDPIPFELEKNKRWSRFIELEEKQ